ncbi:dTMP kinase [Clostridium thermobutyricum]|uniref:Thymidylate kinase n=1 Tax=Clostridium thermobutyricum DSM 4928 TaxID=1121339 RepID=A0A1V4SS53_9CLOT|nr:dTMP kinase [Clostridium thermobutyricum]OPX46684.1 thymidylate kinase [Clostridium thermobutyricum DSM 4928]
MKKGLFVAFEGGEGSGKSTIIEKIYIWLRESGHECILTREPGGIKISEKIRAVILDKENTEMDGRTEALLYAAARRQHLVEKVIPAINSGKIVLCDRFVDSSLAYQGYARGLGIDEVFEINKFAINDCMPNISILFDINPEIGLERIRKNSSREVNRLDLEKIDFHNKVREGYTKIYENNKDRMIKINAEQSIDQVFEEVKRIFLDLL